METPEPETPLTTEPVTITVEARAHGWRIDHYLSRLYPNYSRALFQKSIEQQHVRLNGLPVKPSRRLRVNDRLTVMYMLTNGIQQTEEFNDFKSSHVTAIVTPATGVTWTVNYYAGQEQPDGEEPGGPDGFFRVFDTYVNWAATPALTLALDVNHTTNEVNQADDALSTTGLGAYARYQFAPPAALAVRYEHLSYDDVIARNLQVMDTAAFALCRDNQVPLRIYDMMQPGALMRILKGEALGTLVSAA